MTEGGAQAGSEPSGGVRPCRHCGTEVEVARVADSMPVYCCGGCEAAAAIIAGAGLEDWYARRSAPGPRPGLKLAAAWAAYPVDVAVDGKVEASLRLDGLRCAACVWLCERVLQQGAGVTDAQVSFGDGQARVRWDPAVTDLGRVLEPVVALGYQPRARGAPEKQDYELLTRLGVASFCAANVMLLSVGLYLGWWGGMDPRFQALFQWAGLVLSTPVALWSALPFYRSALAGLRHGLLHTDLPVSIGVIVMYGHALWAVPRGEDAYLDSLCAFVALLLAGRMLDQRGRDRARAAASLLAAEAPRTARRAVGGRVETVPVGALEVGDLLELGTGEEVAADGVVEVGAAEVRMALLTGESAPRAVAAGDPVVAGALVETGHLQLRVQAVGEHTLLARMAASVARPSPPEPPTAADRIAPWFTGATLGAAALTGLGWSLSGQPALPVVVAVLVVACPCALALSAPLASAAGRGAAARRGLLVHRAGTLRDLARVDLVVFDKTGTVTGGEPEVVEADDAVLRVAAGLERASVHPIARAIVAEASRRGIALPLARCIVEVPGRGIEGDVDGRHYRVQGAGPGLVEVVGLGTIRLRDRLRPDARRVVEALRDRGLDVALLTGDHAEVAARIAAEAGITDVHAGMDPEAKVAWIAARAAQGRRVLFVGDGLNDGPALAEAAVGLAMGAGAASSVQVADAVVHGEGLGPVLAGLRAATEVDRATRRNLRRSLLYNLAVVCAAAAGLVNPLVAAVLMPLSSAWVVAESVRVEARVARDT